MSKVKLLRGFIAPMLGAIVLVTAQPVEASHKTKKHHRHHHHHSTSSSTSSDCTGTSTGTRESSDWLMHQVI